MDIKGWYVDNVSIVGGKEMLNTLEWSPVATLDDPQSVDPLAFPTVTTSYIVSVSDSIGCLGYDTVLVYVEGTQNIILDRAEPGIYIGPNPFENDLYLKWDRGLGSMQVLGIWDLSGKQYENAFQEVDKGAGRIHLHLREPLPTGIYFMRVRTEKGEHTLKLIHTSG